MKFLKLLTTLLFFNINTSNGLLQKAKSFFDFSDINSQKIKLNSNDISGTVPYKYYLILERLKKLKESKQQDTFINRLILYGPSGNGKTTFAKKLADEIDAVLITVQCPLLINQVQGSSAENINSAFEIAFSEHQKNGKFVVIFFDEANSLLNINKEKRLDNDALAQTLCINLDKINNDPNYFVIIASTGISNMHPALLDRFGDNIIEFNFPDTQIRKEIIEFYLTKFDLNLEKNFVTFLIKQTDKLSIRAIENILKSIKSFFIENKKISYSLLDSILCIHKMKIKTSDQSEKKLNDFKSYLFNINLLLNIIPSLMYSIKAIFFFYSKLNIFFKKSDNQITQNTQDKTKNSTLDDLLSRGIMVFH